MASVRDCNFISMAAEEATNSPCGTRVGCVCVLNGHPIAKGCNNYRTYSKDGIIKDSFTCHAECDVIHKINNMYRRDERKRRKVVQECGALYGSPWRRGRSFTPLHSVSSLPRMY